MLCYAQLSAYRIQNECPANIAFANRIYIRSLAMKWKPGNQFPILASSPFIFYLPSLHIFREVIWKQIAVIALQLFGKGCKYVQTKHPISCQKWSLLVGLLILIVYISHHKSTYMYSANPQPYKCLTPHAETMLLHTSSCGRHWRTRIVVKAAAFWLESVPLI